MDKLEALGNPGWNWDSLKPYMVAAERNIPSDAMQEALGAISDPDVHGHDGFVNTSFPVRSPLGLGTFSHLTQRLRHRCVFQGLLLSTKRLSLSSFRG